MARARLRQQSHSSKSHSNIQCHHGHCTTSWSFGHSTLPCLPHLQHLPQEPNATSALPPAWSGHTCMCHICLTILPRNRSTCRKQAAIDYYNDKLRRQSLGQWQLCAKWSRDSGWKEDLAFHHWSDTMLNKALDSWHLVSTTSPSWYKICTASSPTGCDKLLDLAGTPWRGDLPQICFS